MRGHVEGGQEVRRLDGLGEGRGLVPVESGLRGRESLAVGLPCDGGGTHGGFCRWCWARMMNVACQSLVGVLDGWMIEGGSVVGRVRGPGEVFPKWAWEGNASIEVHMARRYWRLCGVSA